MTKFKTVNALLFGIFFLLHSLAFSPEAIAQLGPPLEQTLQSAVATATANGTVQTVLGYATVGVTIKPASSWDGTITFEISDTSAFTTSTAVLCVNRLDGSTSTTYASTTVTANFACPVSGAKYFRARISGRTAGSVTVTARTVIAPVANIATGTGVPGEGTVTSIATSSPITGGTITGVGTIACTTCGVTGTGLSQFAATTSLELKGVISDETGSGALVFATTPTLVTPVLGVATITSLNRVAITAPATSATLTISDGKTLTAVDSVTLRGTGSTTSSATPTINTDLVSFYILTAQAADITSFTTNLSGTPVSGQTLWIAIIGTAARAITWGASFEASTVALPTTTVSTNRLDVGFIWSVASTKWRCVAVS